MVHLDGFASATAEIQRLSQAQNSQVGVRNHADAGANEEMESRVPGFITYGATCISVAKTQTTTIMHGTVGEVFVSVKTGVTTKGLKNGHCHLATKKT